MSAARGGESRGSSEIRTSTGWRAATLVEGKEAVGRVDDVGENHETAVGGLVGEGEPALLAAVGAHEELGAALGQALDASVLHTGHAVVDQIQVHLGAAVERGAAEPEGRVEVRVLGSRGNHESKLALREVHRGAERSIQREERQ